MAQKVKKAANRSALVVAMLLFVLAAITYWDASHMAMQATYVINPSSASYSVALFLVVLGIAHIITAFKPSDVLVEEVDWRAVGWIGLALAGLLGAIALHAGFVLGSTLLFCFTARAFGRHALIADICIGAVLGTVIFLFFNKLLALSLPTGPFERLF